MSLFQGRPDRLAAFRAGDRAVLDTVYRAHVDRVSEIVANGFRIAGTGRAILGLGGRPADLADAVQEIFLKAFARNARTAYDGTRDFEPYLTTIARNVLIDRVRRSGRELLMADVDLDVAGKSAASAAHREVAARWEDPLALEVVRRFVEALPPELAQIHRVRYVEGLSQRQAAQRLGISRQVVRTLEDRLRDGLRRELGRAPAQEPLTAENRERAGNSRGLP
jgi:RNA polymerase sigma-70 factor (ECF subfamily)